MRLLARGRQIASNSPREVFVEFPATMQVLIVLSALVALAVSSPVSPVLVPKVQVAPAQVTVVRQPYTVSEPEPVLRNVPVPVRAVAYTAPHVVPGPVLAPAPYYAHTAYAPHAAYAPHTAYAANSYVAAAPYYAHAAYAPHAAYAGHSIVV